MGNNKMSIDDLIKRIYSLYIDIKTREFDELKKDIMMDDIKNLYVMVKSLGTQNESIINEKHKEILNDIKPVALNIDVEENTEIDNAPTDDSRKVDNIEQEPITEESAFEFSFEEEATPLNPETKKIDSNEEKDIELQDTKKSILNSETIQNYLNKDEAPKKEIYDFLDLNTRIGLVEKFFKGNSIELSECLMLMNNKTSKIECIEILKKYQTKYGIDSKEEIYQTFMELLDRKFN